jgi:glycosyltransferase involved in cell wall biosynthesis
VNSTPDVSVILAVRDGGDHLAKAIDSILVQTFANFELIAVNDGSTDKTAAYLDSISDPRLRVFHQNGAGLAAALNRGISLARGRYLARQDHDDLADPNRISKQVEFLDSHPECALIGTRAAIWVGDTPSGRFHDHPIEDKILRFELLFNNPFVHSSVMMRKSALDRVGTYTIDPLRQPPEDYELWSRIARHYFVANLPERLTVYREVPSSISRVSAQAFIEKLVTISSENLAYTTGATAPQQIHVDIAALVHGCKERLSRKLDIKSMRAVIAEAGYRIGGDQPGPELARRIERARALIWRRAVFRHPVIGWVWHVAAMARERFRRLAYAMIKDRR